MTDTSKLKVADLKKLREERNDQRLIELGEAWLEQNPLTSDLLSRKEPNAILSEIGKAMHRTGDKKRGYDVLYNALAVVPNAILHSALSHLNKADINYPQALSHAEAALPFEPDNVHSIRNLADIHKRMGNFGEAKSYYQLSLHKSRGSRDIETATNGLAQIHLVQGDHQKAREYYSLHADRNIVSLCGLANTCLIDGELDEAEKLYKQPLANGSRVAKRGLAMCYIAQGKLDDAQKLLAGVDKNDTQIQDYYLDAALAMKQGDFKTAREDILSAIQEFPVTKTTFPYVRTFAEAGLIDPPMYEVLAEMMGYKTINPIQPKPLDQVLNDFKSHLVLITAQDEEPTAPISAIYTGNFETPVNKQTQRVTQQRRK